MEGERTASGQLSRSSEAVQDREVSEMKLALEAATWRRRQINPTLTVAEARCQEHGSVVSRWLLLYQTARKRDPTAAPRYLFSELHYDTAEKVHKLFAAYSAVTGSRQQLSASDFDRKGGYDGIDPFGPAGRRAKEVEATYRDVRRAILKSGALGMMAVETIILENKDVPDLLGDLRLALNAAAVCFKMMDKQAA